MTDNITTPIPSSTKFKTKDTGANGHLPGRVLYDSAEGEILGTTADAKSTATDTTAVSAMSVWKQISASVQAMATALAGSLGVTIASGATSIAKAEDVASANADVGIPAMAIQKATPADTAGTDGDYAMLQMSAGRLWVDASGKTLTVASHAVTNAGTFAVQAALETSSISNAGTGLTPKFAKISLSATGTVVAAVTSKKIRVLAWDLSPNAAVNAKWQSHVTPTDLTGLYYMANQGNGQSRPFNPVGWFETVAGEALDLFLSGSVSVGGAVVYVEV